MNKFLYLCLSMAFSINMVFAQDSIFVKHEKKVNYIEHLIEDGETIFSIAAKYNVPPAQLTKFNGKNYRSSLEANEILYIPLGRFNYIQINSVVKSKEIYYKNKSNLSYRALSNQFKVPANLIQQWNKLQASDPINGRTLQIGWIHFDDEHKEKKPYAKPNIPTTNDNLRNEENNHSNFDRKLEQIAERRLMFDSLAHLRDSLNVIEEKQISEYEHIFKVVNQGYSLFSESGAAVFFPLKLNLEEGIYYAFHNTITRGTIVKIENPASGHVIYAKIIGSIPATKEYQNAIIGISNNAIMDLGAKDRRMFCKIEYGN